MTTYTERFAAEKPVRTYRAERCVVPANALHDGDVVLKAGQPVGTYNRVNSNFGPKWTQLRDEQGNLLLKAEATAGITVERQVETDESADAMYRWFEIESLAKDLDDALGNSPEAYVAALAAKRAENVAKEIESAERHGKSYTPSPVGFNLLDSFRMTELMAVQAEYNFACHVVARLEKGHDIIRAYALTIAYALRGSVADPLSRSTSVVSNIQEDLDRYVADRKLTRMGGQGVRDAVAEIQAIDRH